LPTNKIMWCLRRADGFEGVVTTSLNELALASATEADEMISEVVTVESASGNPTTIRLQGQGLTHSFDRATVTVAGNIARSTHGETVEEVAGSGDAATVFQTCDVRQGPLTHVRTGTASGMASTLNVRVNDLLWNDVPSLYGCRPNERVYVERLGDGETTTIHFGDGITGARLPSGQENVRLRYRKGCGLEGMVRAGQLTQLMDRPLGVKEVGNPLPAEGADDPETLSEARQNAPLTVLTLERVVSLHDYEAFACAYPGIAKALATWTWDGRKRGVFLTVAGPEGRPVSTGPESVGSDLLKALRAAGDPFVPLRVETCRSRLFEIAGTVMVHPDHDSRKVLTAAREALRARFSFAARQLGQPVMLSEVIGVLQSIAGVMAVDVDHLQRTDRTESVDPAPRLLADLPCCGAGADVAAAELLLLAPGDLKEVKAVL